MRRHAYASQTLKSVPAAASVGLCYRALSRQRARNASEHRHSQARRRALSQTSTHAGTAMAASAWASAAPPSMRAGTLATPAAAVSRHVERWPSRCGQARAASAARAGTLAGSPRAGKHEIWPRCGIGPRRRHG
jgi:hypothetical protein